MLEHHQAAGDQQRQDQRPLLGHVLEREIQQPARPRKQASIAATSATGNASSDPTALRRGAKPDRSAASSVDIDAPHAPGTPGAAPRRRGLGSSRRPGAPRSELTAPAVR